MLQEVKLQNANNARLEECHVALVTGRQSEDELAEIYRDLARPFNGICLDDVNWYRKHEEK
jgi:hypothetical protein